MEQILAKNETISRIKRGSLIIGGLCLLTALIYALLAFTPLGFGSAAYGGDPISRANIVRMRASSGITFATMLCTSAVFFRIHKSGKPFSRGNIIIVRVMGVVTIANSFVPAGLYAALMHDPKVFVGAFSGASIVSGLLILFIAQIMYYGSLLQQESDETL